MEEGEIHICEEKRLAYIGEREFSLQGREKAINALTDTSIEERFTENFLKFMKAYIHQCPNKDKTETEYGTSSQKLNKRFYIEMFTIWEEFGPLQGAEIIRSCNRREKIANYTEGREIGININTSDFYRDSNYSISLYDTQRKKELAIVAFYPKKGKILEIVQIQGKKSENISKDDLGALIFQLKGFAKQQGFKKIHILNGDKNYHYRAPGDFPKEGDIKQHQASFKKIYNGYPHRYRGFSKAGEWYSEYEG